MVSDCRCMDTPVESKLHQSVLVTIIYWFQSEKREKKNLTSMRHLPSTLPSLRSMVQPLNQGILSEGSSMLSPCQPEMGTNATVAGLYPDTGYIANVTDRHYLFRYIT